MPQLDPTILTNQVIWFFLFFFASYFVFLKYVLPVLSIITKFNKKELLNVLTKLQSVNNELVVLNADKNMFLYNYLNIANINSFMLKYRHIRFPVHKFEITKFFLYRNS